MRMCLPANGLVMILHFVNITKDDNYVYEDNDGKYDAEFADGVLKTVAENDLPLFTWIKTANLVLTYMDNIIEYKKD